jgi:hypothetical protein
MFIINTATNKIGICMMALILVTKPTSINRPQTILSIEIIVESADEFSANTVISAFIID